QVKQALLQANQDAERELRVSEAKFREVYTSSAAGIAISDLDGKLVETNQALREILADPSGEFAGRSLCELVHPDDVASLKASCQELLTAGRTRFRPPRRFRLIGRDGEPAWTYLAVSLLHDADGNPTHQVTIVEDVTELHLLGEQLRHQSLHDALTGLPNQQFFVSRLERALGRGGRVTVCTIDLDSFAVINDAFGRQVGDKVLQRVGEQLQSVVTGQDATVARFGADRFAILVESSSPTPDIPTPDVAALAARIHSALAEPVYFGDHGVAVSCGIGIASRDSGALEPAELLRAAEAALHRVKSSSKRQWALYDPHRDDEHRARCRLAATMPGAWESGEISVEYQPMARLHDGSVTRMQALLRWDHPQQGLLPHEECLQLAAQTGLALPLGQWMLHHAAEHFAAWRKLRAETGDKPGPLLQLDLLGQHAHDPDLVTTVSCALERAGLTTGCLRIGMPVSALRADQGEAVDNLHVLSELGVGIAMLGCSGAGAVAHLEDLPIDAAELAPQLVQRVTERGIDSAVARAVPPLVHLMQTWGAHVIVRNIDTAEQATWWHRAGADIGQGPYFAPPGPLS
ncbi:MAG TPA: EAL domain-containing protein, partial [Pseudonocardiaceae bacterium]|nr:EAL domain-containing protein [Pseudonocardiaceae bacterium]